jgi:hypothetical protein
VHNIGSPRRRDGDTFYGSKERKVGGSDGSVTSLVALRNLDLETLGGSY